MKKVLSVLLILALSFSLAACGSDSKLYYDYDMSKYVALGEYSKEVDRASDTYKELYDEFYSVTFGDDLAYKAEEGVIEEGDIANIDYAGYKDGVAFNGGTASDYDLTIGSGQFIDGFEDGLIGAEIGSTVDLNLTFPENYGNEELNGAAVVFTVTVNYATKYAEPREENVKKYGFASLSDYEKAADEYAIGISVFYNIFDEVEIKEYPEKEHKLLLDSTVDYYTKLCTANNITLESFVSSYGWDVDGFKDYLSTDVISNYMDYDMISHYILQQRDIKFGKEDIEATRAELVKKYAEDLENYGYNELEIQRKAVFDKACSVLLEEATVK